MEELLNKLIQRGWKPFGDDIVYMGYRPEEKIFIASYDGIHGYPISLRDLTSIECGLWQFVCENYLIELNGDEIEKKYKSEGEYPLRYEKHYGVYHSDLCRQEFIKYETPEFWIIESALCDEDKLEKFLLDNIKV